MTHIYIIEQECTWDINQGPESENRYHGFLVTNTNTGDSVFLQEKENLEDNTHGVGSPEKPYYIPNLSHKELASIIGFLHEFCKDRDRRSISFKSIPSYTAVITVNQNGVTFTPTRFSHVNDMIRNAISDAELPYIDNEL